jgi:hypothetical protein
MWPRRRDFCLLGSNAGLLCFGFAEQPPYLSQFVAHVCKQGQRPIPRRVSTGLLPVAGPVPHYLLDLVAPEGPFLTRLDLEAKAASDTGEPVTSLQGPRLHDQRTEHGAPLLMLDSADTSEHRADAPKPRPFPVVLLGINSVAEIPIGDLRLEGMSRISGLRPLNEVQAHPLFDRR